MLFWAAIICCLVLRGLVTSGQMCRNADVDRAQVEIFDPRFSTKILDTATGKQIMLEVTISWNTLLPDGLKLDGFLVKLSSDKTIAEEAIAPSYVCNPGTNFWVNANDILHCITTPPCQPILANMSDTLCLCQHANCTLTAGEDKCRGTNYWIENGYTSVKPIFNNLTFAIDFETLYIFEIRPYYREFAKRFGAFQMSVDRVNCHQLAQETHELSETETTQLCTCDSGIPHQLPRNVSVQDFLPDFTQDSISANVTWLPPVTQTGLTDVTVFVYRSDGFPSGSVQPSEIILREENVTNSASCDNLTFYYRALLFNLQPGVEYTVEILNRYSEQMLSCRRCNSRFNFFAVVDPCEKRWQYCDSNAACLTNHTSRTLNATCECQPGFEGNGLNNDSDVLGTGCSDVDYCVPTLTPCVSSALCFDNIAPAIGATCRCPSDMFGDGYKYGFGCSEISTLVIGICVPLLVILIVVIAWKIRVRRIRQNELTWSKFVANKSIVIENFMNEMEYDKNGKCAPTFGEKWEIERSNMEMGKILGRGNCGIVHMGWYEKIENDKPTRIPTAVKLLKDGVDDQDNLMNFLSEISFMLNIGYHPNILQVIGCCTVEKPVMLVTEYLKYGDLRQFLIEAREPEKCSVDPVYHITEKSLYQMARHVAQGMDYLTKSRIIHGDLAARNILVGEDLVCKISDFGLANDVYRYGVIKGQAERIVPFKWISPERMMAGKVPITSKSDVWSFGNLMYEMVTLGCMPHPGVASEDLLDKLKGGYRMKQPSTCSNNMYSIMSKCWKWNAYSRPSFAQLTKMLDGALQRVKEADYIIITMENPIDDFEFVGNGKGMENESRLDDMTVAA